MKNLVRVLSAVLMAGVLLTGCGRKSDSEKMCRMEIISEEEQTVIKSIYDMTQDEVAAFLDIDHELDISGFSLDIPGFDIAKYESSDNYVPEGELVPEYRIILYQEKTETLVKSGDSDEYGKIMEYVTYRDSDVIKMIICSDEIESVEFPEELLTVYFDGTDKFFSNLQEVLNSVD